MSGSPTRRRLVGKGIALFLMSAIFIGVSASKARDEDWWILSAGDAVGNVYLIDGFAKSERDGAASYHAHFFYKTPIDGVSSAQIEYYVNCNEKNLREARYIDFDASRRPIYSGDNYELNEFSKPGLGTIGEELIIFSCATADERRQRYTRVDGGVDKWALGESLISASASSS